VSIFGFRKTPDGSVREDALPGRATPMDAGARPLHEGNCTTARRLQGPYPAGQR